MSLGKFKEDPWQNSHPLYQESAFAMTPAPENANSEIILFSLYRVLGFAGLHEGTVPQNGRDLDRAIQQFRNRKLPRKGAALDADSFHTMIHSPLESPKLPSQSSKRFLQVTPLVPQAATFSGSARLTGSPWLPGAMVRRMVWLGAANAQAAEATWKALFDALSVSSTDDVFARFVQHEMAAWSPDLVWSPTALGEPPEPLDPADWEGLTYPARQFVGDLQSIIDAKDSLTRRQWTSLLEAILRIGVVSHVLWLCEIHDRTWRCLRDTMAGAGPATPGQVREAVLPRRVTGFSYGDRAMATIKDRASAFLIARLGINAVLWALAGDQEAGSNLYTSQGLLSLCEAVRRAQPSLDRLAVPALVADLGERENRTIICRKGSGIEHVKFVAVENGTDYWAVLWNGRQLRSLPMRSRLAPFGSAFGISVGGITAGFSATQVGRALEDVSDLLAAKPVVSVAVASAGGTTDACNEGLLEWCSSRYRQDERRPVRQSVGPRKIDIYNDLDAGSRPEDATIANLSEDSDNAVRWFVGQPARAIPDLGIIAQLDMSEPSVIPVVTRTPISPGGLVRHRIRRQLPNGFLSESRQSLPPAPSGEGLTDKVGACIAAMENLGEQRCGLSLAPNLNAIRHMIFGRHTDYVAVSSSAIDPACFLGEWLEGAFLWDYDLPSYSHRAGDTSGYYLLSSVKEADRELLSKALARLPGCGSLDESLVQNVLLEIARRGIPTIKGLAGDNTEATGNLGLFLAVRLLQDRFRIGAQADSLLPVIGGREDEAQVVVIVPVDPFRGYLSDLARSIPAERKDASLSRPDLLVVGMYIGASSVRLRLTPVEVKCRPGPIYPSTEVLEALEQARSLSRLLGSMLPREGQPRAWTLAFQHLLLSLVGFGMRVYSQHPDVVDQEQWAAFHEKLAAAVLSGEASVEVDPHGRLIIVDDSPWSSPKDCDGDDFDETITIGIEDAGKIVGGDPVSFYDSVRAKVGQWRLLPEQREAVVSNEQTSTSSPDLALTTSPQAVSTALLEPGFRSKPRPETIAHPLTGEVQAASLASNGIILHAGSTVDGFEPHPLALNISDIEQLLMSQRLHSMPSGHRYGWRPPAPKFVDSDSNANASFSIPRRPFQPALDRPRLSPPQPAKASTKAGPPRSVAGTPSGTKARTCIL